MRRTLLYILLWCAGTASAQVADSLSRGGADSVRSLNMSEVEVLAQRRRGEATTSYLLNRLALDHHQMLNIAGIAALLPGGKTVNPTLTDDTRIGLRSGTAERGNATFGTAIEIDGMRMDNNGMMDETSGASMRAIGVSNIESVEVIAGIPSVEHGDVSNGVVKVNTRRGNSPFIFEAATNPYTKQVSLNKGLTLRKVGTFNFSVEHAQSFTSITSPHTSYKRNALSLAYARAVSIGPSTFSLKASASGNIGGYNSEADPDAFADTWQRVRDNQLRLALSLTWICEKTCLGKLRTELFAAYSASDKQTENYVNKSSSSAQPMLHAMENGYFIVTDAPADALPPIMLGPTGYWYERSFHDQKPQTWQLKAKATLSSTKNSVLFGTEYKSSCNKGRGIYYEDLALAPTWRPYRYDALPALQSVSLFAEDRFETDRLQLTAGLRLDANPSNAASSAMNRSSALSPRVNAKYSFPSRSPKGISVALHAGYGKSVKLPSLQILYPADTYLDKLAFSPGTTAAGKAFYAYNTYVSKAVHDQELKWQYTNQIDIGAEAGWRGARLSVSLFIHKTFHPYQQVYLYEPVSYRYTSQAALEDIAIPVADRLYAIDRESGTVSVQSASSGQRIELPGTMHYTYNHNRRFVNGSPVTRYGVEWILDLPKLPLGASPLAGTIALRLDGNYYRYKGLDRTLFAGAPNGVKDATDGPTLIGYYLGSNTTSASTAATPSVSSGSLSGRCNLNATVTLHIPRIRFIATLRFESTLLDHKRQLSNATQATRGYPLYYSTWDTPGRLIPFAAAYHKALADGDTQLSASLRQLIVATPTDYYFDPQRISAYCSANLSLTKQIGSWLSISFYANNFLNSMQTVSNSQTGLRQSLFNGGLIPKFYYGMALRLTI